MVCVAVWMSYSGKTVTDKAFIMIMPIGLFVASGFEPVSYTHLDVYKRQVKIGAGCVLKNVTIGDDVEIKPYSVLEDATIGEDVYKRQLQHRYEVLRVMFSHQLVES